MTECKHTNPPVGAVVVHSRLHPCVFCEREQLQAAALVMLAAIALVNDETNVGEFRAIVVGYLEENEAALELWLDALRANGAR